MIKKLCLFSLFLYLFFLQAYLAFHFTTDDAFISLRYAKHLSEGMGLVWNKGELPLEGYSNFAWVMFEALLFYLKLNVVFIIKCVGLACLLGSVIVLYCIARFWLTPLLSVLPSLMMLFHRGEILWTVSGLETGLYQLLVLLTVYCLLKGLDSKRYLFYILSGVFHGIAALTRVEAPLLIIGFAIAFYLFSRNRSDFKVYIKGFWLYFSAFLLIYLPYFCWHYYYFGRILANSVYCKAFMSAVPGFLDLDYLLLVSPLAIFFIPLFIQRFDKRFYLLLFPSLIYFMVLLNAEYLVVYFHRLFLPAFVLLLPMVVLGIQSIFKLPALKLSTSKAETLTILCVLGVSFFLVPSYVPVTNYSKFVHIGILSQKQRQRIGRWLKTHVKPTEKVSVDDCGVIPFEFGGPVIDSYCLNSYEMTRPPIDLSYKRFVDWILFEEKPAFVILLAVTQQYIAYRPPFDIELIGRDRFNLDYTKVKRFMVGDNTNGYYYDIYRRNRDLSGLLR